MPRNLSVRARLVALMLAGMLPMGIAALATIYGLYAEEKRSFEQQVLGTTRALSLVVDQELARRESLLKTLALSPTLARGDLEAFYRYARQVAPDVDNVIVLSDLAGQQLLNTRRPFGAAGLPRTSFDGLGADRAATVVSDLYYAPFGKAHSFAVRVPVMVDSELRYHLSMGGFASHLQEVLEGQNLPSTWFGSVVDRQGHIVARSRNGNAIVGMRVSDTTLAQMGGRREGSLWATSREGQHVFATYTTSERHGWRFIIGIAETEVTGTLNRAVGRFAGAALLLTSVAVGLAWWMGRAIAEPVESIGRAARALGAGQPVQARPTGLKETDTVLAAMQQASEGILHASRTMAQQVQAAVAQAERAQAVVLQSQRMEAIAHLTGGIAHDVNNLLMVIGTNVHLLRRQSASALGEKSLAAIQRSVSAGARLTRQLLTFARRQPVSPQRLDLNGALPGLLELIQPAVGSDIAVRTRLADAPVPVVLDLHELELALLNLALNAKDAMPSGGELEVAVGREVATAAGDPDHAVLSVRDQGHGIAPEHLARVFEPFFTTKPAGSGTGLGLSQVFGMCEQAGGSVRITSEPGRGTTVTLRFPVHHGGSDTPTPSDTAPHDETLDARVLLVEDNTDVREATREVLVTAGVHVTTAVDAEEALRRVDERTFDVVLSDIRMPGALNGIDLAERLRASHPSLGVLLHSGYTDQLQRAQALGLTVLQKPSAPESLLRALRQAVHRAGPGRPA